MATTLSSRRKSFFKSNARTATEACRKTNETKIRDATTSGRRRSHGAKTVFPDINKNILYHHVPVNKAATDGLRHEIKNMQIYAKVSAMSCQKTLFFDMTLPNRILYS